MGRAFIWDAQDGMRDLQTLLVSLGADLTGWSLTEARAISADGRVIVGTGTNPQAATEAWIAYLPAAACYANCDDSSTPPILNVNDFVCFQSRFVAGDTWANCDGSTAAPILNVADFVCFMNRYAAGCE